ncbi:LysR family transcriptional regulator [Aeromonas caviae]|uniref:LysR family transcriptional regulator n=1 Tax=Aeromonas caviae TaxID=648 RepID=UPI003EC6E50A
MNFTFRQIRYFVAVADSFSVSRAAAELHISQSAVTSAIRELETELGAALFERNPRGVSLTTQGHQFLLHARRILSAMTEAGQSLKALGEEPMISLTADQLDQIIGGGLRRYGIAPRIVLRTASVEAVRSLVASQLGLALLPDFAYRPWSLEQERVEARAIKEPIPAIDIGLVWRCGSRLDWAAREFIDIARDQSRLRARQHLPR